LKSLLKTGILKRTRIAMRRYIPLRLASSIQIHSVNEHEG
jgi:hypothetical protein